MLHLQDLAKQSQHNRSLMIIERLPVFLVAPCHLNVSFHVKADTDFFLIHLKVTGQLNTLCQRCMQEFCYPYDNTTVIAVCRSDQRAEELLEHYECIVSPTWQVSLEELVIDELHLYAPQFHPDINDCGNEVNQILTSKSETY